ncbi:MAG TPA: tetratricopeptide repeat protein [Planctomycetota bacterium]|jgi:tetratricopeptide (TPR) repeat protein|nr:tetratricopeptide repeat protein [Planctomycetota bacterium]
MLRLIGFFVVTLVVMHILRQVPVIGRLFDIPIVGFWGTAILVSAAASHFASSALARRQAQRRIRDLGHVDTPHNQGKLGSLLAGSGRFRAAVPHLERAVAGEPTVAEWQYRLGCALLETARPREAAAALARAAEIDEEHAYGAVLARLCEARLASGDAEGALDAIVRRERNHGADPESAYRRGVSEKALGRKQEARKSFAEARHLASSAARFHRARARKFALLAFVAGLTS